jgi:hypothetical protein
VLALLLTACSSAPAAGPASSGTGTSGSAAPRSSATGSATPRVTPTLTAADVPALPAPVAVSGSPSAVAAALAKATADSVKDTTPGWLAAYRYLGIPVIDPRTVKAGADPVGPRWAQVWSIGQVSRDKGAVSGVDAAVVLSLGTTPSVPATTLMADLRSDASSTSPRRQTLARFLAAKSLANGGADPLVTTTTADQTRWDPASLQLAQWVLLREGLSASLPKTGSGARLPAASRHAATPAYAVVPATLTAPSLTGAGGTPCSEFFGSSDATSWINYVAGKIGGGVGIAGGPSLPGLLEGILGVGGTAADKAASEVVGTFIGRAGAAASLISLIAELSALSVDVHEDEIVHRKREVEDGGPGSISIDLSYDFAAMDADKPTVCALTTIANALGVGLSLPADKAPISGAEVLASPGHNMPDKVQFSGDAQKFSLDDNGHGVINVLGRKRPKELPQSAKEVEDDFDLNLEAQPEGVTAQTLLTIFLDGLALSPTGAISAAADIAKTFHYSLGNFSFLFYDYHVHYTASGGAGPVSITGSVDNIEAPFDLKVVSPGATGTVTLYPAGTQGGTLHGKSKLGFGSEISDGSYTMAETKTGFIATGTVVSCLTITKACSPESTFQITFTAD